MVGKKKCTFTLALEIESMFGRRWPLYVFRGASSYFYYQVMRYGISSVLLILKFERVPSSYLDRVLKRYSAGA